MNIVLYYVSHVFYIIITNFKCQLSKQQTPKSNKVTEAHSFHKYFSDVFMSSLSGKYMHFLRNHTR